MRVLNLVPVPRFMEDSLRLLLSLSIQQYSVMESSFCILGSKDFFLIKSELAAKLLINQVITAFAQWEGSLFLNPRGGGEALIRLAVKKPRFPWIYPIDSIFRAHVETFTAPQTFCCFTVLLCAILESAVHKIAFDCVLSDRPV